MYAIKNEHGDFYTGNDYIFQGEKYANFTAYTDEVKTYRSLKIAENVKKRLETNSNGFRNLEVVVLVKGKSWKEEKYEK